MAICAAGSADVFAAPAELESGTTRFGMLLRQHRIAAGLSQEALAERAGMSCNGIGALERGERRTPRQATLATLARALGLGELEREAFASAAARGRSRTGHLRPHRPAGRESEFLKMFALLCSLFDSAGFDSAAKRSW